MAKPLILGIIVSIISSMIIVVVCAIAATNIAISDEGILIMAITDMAIGAFIGGMVSARLYNEKGFLIGALNGMAFFLITTIVSIAINPAALTVISVIKLFVFTLSSMIGGVIGVNVTRKRKF